MKYRIINLEHDDFIAILFAEMEYDIRNGEKSNVESINVIKTKKNTKGAEIQELIIQMKNSWSVVQPFLGDILIGLASAGLYDVVKSSIKRLQKMPEFTSEKKIKIVQEDNDGNKTTAIISLQEIIEKK